MMQTSEVNGRGWAIGGDAAAREALRLWFGLAQRSSGGAIAAALGAVMGSLDADAVLPWARGVLALADEAEGGMAPNAGATEHPDGGALLHWSGTYTVGRYVEVHIWDAGDGLACRLEWDTATGRPSRFLGLPEMVEGPAWQDSGPMPDDATS